jgi:hypothetical protein
MGTRIFRCFGVLAAIAFCAIALSLSPNVAFAQSGVDNSTATGVFQMEGDAQRTATICFLPLAGGGPAIATPGSTSGGNPNKLDINGCPTVNPAGSAATWSLIPYGANTDDWSSFAYSNVTGGFTNKAHSLFDPAFDADPVGSGSDNTFLGTASKDTDDISAWSWNPHGVQDKDDIAHSGAAAYHLTNGDTAIYAFMDRFSNAGDATAGFWFVQDSTFALCVGNGLAATGNGGTVANPSCTASGTFVGHHTAGDLLIVSDFSQGGAVSTINIFTWNGSTIVLTKTLSPAPCDPLNGGSDFCGQVNNAFAQVIATKGKLAGQPVLVAATVAPGGWPFNEKTAGATQFVTGEFLEIGVDLNKIFGGTLPCFSTFFSETRSSTSSGASLSDLTVPVSFPLCSLTVSKQCDTATIVNGNQVQYNFSGDVTNTGSSTLYSPKVYDTPPTGATNLTITGPTGPIPGNSSTGGHYAGSFISSSILASTDKNRVSAAASSNQSGTPLNVVCGTNPPTSDTNECADWGSPCTILPTPGLTLNKLCSTCLVSGNDLHVQVNEAFKVCNTGNVNISNITVKDCQGGTYTGSPGSQNCSGTEVTVATIASLGAQVGNTPTCSNVITNTYTPKSTGVCDNSNNNSCILHDEAIASGTGALGSGTVFANQGVPKGANCPVCPINTTCSTPTL